MDKHISGAVPTAASREARPPQNPASATDPRDHVFLRKIDCGSTTETSRDRLIIHGADRLLQRRHRPRQA